jgi:hypothetical protein
VTIEAKHCPATRMSLAAALLGFFVLLCSAGPLPASAAGCANEALREEQGSGYLPDCRAYEMVSPLEKGFVNVEDAILGNYKVTIGEDGNAISYCNAGAGGAQITLRCGAYVSRRSEGTGWQTRVLGPRACGTDLEGQVPTQGGQQRGFLSSDLAFAVIEQPEAATCGIAPLDPLAPVPGKNLYRESLTTNSPIYELLTPRLGSATTRSFNTENGEVVGGSKDFAHVIMLSSGDQCQPDCNELSVDGTRRLFDWTEGEARLVSRGPDNLPLVGGSAIGSLVIGGGGTALGVEAVSADGTHIYFQNPAGEDGCSTASCELYLRKDGTSTAWTSEQECSPACSNNSAADAFLWANPAGDRALFGTGAKLVNTDTSASVAGCPGSGGSGFLTGNSGAPLGCDLYQYRDGPEPASEPDNLVDLSIDNEPSDGVSGSLQGVLGMSDDGNTVYFVAASQLISGGPTNAGEKIYRWTWDGGNPQMQYLGPAERLNHLNGTNRRPTLVRVDPTGEHLLLETKAALNPVVDTDTDRDIYRWGEGEGWLCVSCQQPGTQSMGSAGFQLTSEFGGLLQNADLERVASADMERMFFMTPDALVSADVNGQGSCPILEQDLGTGIATYRCQDLYEWHDGAVNLISSGVGNGPVKFVGTTLTGNDAFFTTSDQLVGRDTDKLADFYDARVEGGLPEPVPPLPPCETPNSCRNPTPPPIAEQRAANPGPPGTGNEKQAPLHCPKGRKKVEVKGRVVCKKVVRSKRHQEHHKSGKGR